MLHLAQEFAQALGVNPDPNCVRFEAPSRVRLRVKKKLREINPRGRPILVLHPGPTWPVREWPLNRWCELAELIRARTTAIMIKIGTDLDSMHSIAAEGVLVALMGLCSDLDAFGS